MSKDEDVCWYDKLASFFLKIFQYQSGLKHTKNPKYFLIEFSLSFAYFIVSLLSLLDFSLSTFWLCIIVVLQIFFQLEFEIKTQKDIYKMGAAITYIREGGFADDTKIFIPATLRKYFYIAILGLVFVFVVFVSLSSTVNIRQTITSCLIVFCRGLFPICFLEQILSILLKYYSPVPKVRVSFSIKHTL